MRPTIKRVLVAFLACAVALWPALVMTGCGEDPAAAVTEKIDNDFSQVKDLNTDAINELVGDDIAAQLADYGVSVADVYQAFYQHFDYSVTDVQVDGDTAVATVDCSNVDLAQILPQWVTELTTWATSDEAAELYGSDGGEGVATKAVQMLMDDMTAEDAPTISGTATVTLQKTDDTWDYADSQELATVFLGGQDYSEILSTLDL